jgi:F0F1-type ATP synthase delta subunit
MTPTRWISECARAIIDRSIADDVVVDVLRSAYALDRAFVVRPSMVSDLSNPANSLVQRDAAIVAALKGLCHPYVINACRLLLAHNAFEDVRIFLGRIRREARLRANIEDAEIRTMDELTGAMLKNMEESLSESRGRRVILHPASDKTIEAGFLVDGLDWSLDATLRGARVRLTSHLLV